MTSRRIDLVNGVLLIGLLWRLLERILYGEIRPSIEDTIIAGAWIAFVVLAYRQGRKDEREGRRD